MDLMPPPAFSQRAARSQGQPISELMQVALQRPELISLAAGFVDQATLPVEATRQAVDYLLSQPARARAALQYGTNAGLLPLRERLLADHLAADGTTAHASKTSVEQVVVTAGSNELLHLLVDTLCDPGDIILCAAPSYFVFLGMAANLGVRTIGVAADAQGLIPEALEEQLVQLKAAGELPCVKAVYLVTYFDNPAGVTLSADRRGLIVEIVKRWSKEQTIYVLDDSAYRLLRYEGSDPPSLRAYDPEGEHVVLTETFSKSYSPGLRVGYGILPPALTGPVLAQKGNIDFGSANFNQELIHAVLELGLLAPHLKTLRQSYLQKRDAMLSSLKEHLDRVPGCRWERPAGGLYVWLQLPQELDTDLGTPLWNEAIRRGVLYVPGRYCYPAEGVPAARHCMRLSFGVQSPERIAAGIAALAKAICGLMAERNRRKPK